MEEIKEEETGTSVEETTTTTAEKIVPVTPTHSSVSPVETGKVHPSVNPTEVVIGTDAPGKRVEETTVATAPIAPATTAAETTAEEIRSMAVIIKSTGSKFGENLMNIFLIKINYNVKSP